MRLPYRPDHATKEHVRQAHIRRKEWSARYDVFELVRRCATTNLRVRTRGVEGVERSLIDPIEDDRLATGEIGIAQPSTIGKREPPSLHLQAATKAGSAAQWKQS